MVIKEKVQDMHDADKEIILLNNFGNGKWVLNLTVCQQIHLKASLCFIIKYIISVVYRNLVMEYEYLLVVMTLEILLMLAHIPGFRIPNMMPQMVTV